MADAARTLPCRSCGAPLEHVFVDLGMSPISNAMRLPSEAHLAESFYPLRTFVCGTCKLVQIDDVQPELPVRLLRGCESDILRDGSLDHPLALLRQLEIVVASIHRRHRQGESEMTERLKTAISQPCFKVWGHPLGGMLLRREPVACRFEELVDAMREADVAVELNGDPHRMDLDPARARLAAAAGIPFVLSSDAHSTRDLDHLEYAVALARRARLRKRDVLNTLPPDEFAQRVRPIPT